MSVNSNQGNDLLELLKTILTIYGAVLSTLLAFVGLYRDRARIAVSVKGGWRASPGTVYGDANLVHVNVVNKGRRPVTINKCAILLPKGSSHGYILCADSLSAIRPVELSEGKAHDYIYNEDKINKEFKIKPSQYVAVVYDSTGRAYWSHGRLLRFLKLKRLS